MDWSQKGSNRFGKFETYKTEDVPDNVLKTALRSANLIGDGLYGVDLKLYKNKPYIIEINDNPSIESGIEDQILKDGLYSAIMKHFYDKIHSKKNNGNQTKIASAT